jgi:hypothetical protein
MKVPGFEVHTAAEDEKPAAPISRRAQPELGTFSMRLAPRVCARDTRDVIS